MYGTSGPSSATAISTVTDFTARALRSCYSRIAQGHHDRRSADRRRPASTMKFILVNHRSPLQVSTCTECDRPLGTGYLREVSSQRQYCDYDCYLRDEARTLFMPWLSAPRNGSRPMPWPYA